MIYLVVGVPASGKSWVCEQLRGSGFLYLPHDEYVTEDSYSTAIRRLAKEEVDFILAELPFSMDIERRLNKAGYKVTTVFIVETTAVLNDRYLLRRGKKILKGHLTRQATFLRRAKRRKAFYGTSTEVLKHLRELWDERAHRIHADSGTDSARVRTDSRDVEPSREVS